MQAIRVPLLRSIVLLLTLCVGLPGFSQNPTFTAAEAWQRIQQHYAAKLPANSIDGLKAGDPNVAVHGVAVTFLDTMDVLREADRRGANLIITHEPTFYNHADSTAALQNDPVYQQKLAFIQQHGMAVYRLHDAIHFSATGDHIVAGLYRALGWQDYPHPAGPFSKYFVAVPATTLAQLSAFLESRLHARTLRIVGDPSLHITGAALLPGSSGLNKQVLALEQPSVQVLIAGEASEWETVEYTRDAVAQGRPKALVLIGHEVSEEPGMEDCAKDLRALFPRLQVEHISAGQAMWRPEQ